LPLTFVLLKAIVDQGPNCNYVLLLLLLPLLEDWLWPQMPLLLLTLLGAGEEEGMVVVLEASSSSFCLVRHVGCAGGVLPLLLTLLGAGEEEGMLVVLEASSPSSLFC
jgi:hypothetical protein